MGRRLIGMAATSLIVAGLAGCEFARLAGGMAQNYEYQKLLEVLPQYDDLSGKRVAVLVNADMATLYEFPMLSRQIAGGVTLRLARDVPGIKLLNPDQVLAWQFNTADWSAMPYSDITQALDVDRLVYVDLYEYRLHPPGDSWMWDGVAAATVGVVERDSIDPDYFAQTMDVITTFPDKPSVTRDELSQEQMQAALLTKFIRDTAWLFHKHLEPKYPDKYQGELPQTTPAM